MAFADARLEGPHGLGITAITPLEQARGLNERRLTAACLQVEVVDVAGALEDGELPGRIRRGKDSRQGLRPGDLIHIRDEHEIVRRGAGQSPQHGAPREVLARPSRLWILWEVSVLEHHMLDLVEVGAEPLPVLHEHERLWPSGERECALNENEPVHNIGELSQAQLEHLQLLEEREAIKKTLAHEPSIPLRTSASAASFVRFGSRPKYGARSPQREAYIGRSLLG